jgi:EAL domain-containing protein (putative c-di-GMP-specific phosphodiesterase class I)
MVRLLSEYAHKHGIKTVAEGIEVPEEAQVCSDLGIRWLQGYHLKRPIPFSTFQNDIL